jgi:heptosyltransferase II
MARQLPKIEKILIIQTAFIGDVVLVTPLIKASRAHFPFATVDIMVIPAAANIVETNPALDRVIIYDKHKSQSGWRGFAAVARKLRQEHYDLLLAPHRSLRSAMLAWWSRAPIRVGFSTSSGARLFSHRVVYNQSDHETERNLSLLTPLGIDPGLIRPEIFPTDADRFVVDQLLTGLSRANAPFIAMAPGSIWATKRWPADAFRRLAEKADVAGLAVIWVGGESDRLLCESISRGSHGRWINSAGRLTLRQSAELIRRAEVLVSNDSAPLHLASAVNAPAVAIFGPTVPAFGFAPSSDSSVVVQQILSCRPCSIHGGKKCPIDTHECMTSISPAMVFTEVMRIIMRKSENERNN